MLVSLGTVFLAAESFSPRFFFNKRRPRIDLRLSRGVFSSSLDQTHFNPGEGFFGETGSCVWLVVGDGDLSYSANLARSVSADHRIQVVATVLEQERTHRHVYRNSIVNSDMIVQNGGRLQFGVDATKLETHFPENSIRRLIFNFPHWRGKSNIKYNRKLLNDFLASANKVLDTNEDSEIHIALCEGQGGADAATIHEWKSVSWLAPALAATHGLLLRRIERFHLDYDLSSHRGTDRTFSVGAKPQLHVFGRPNGEKVNALFQVSYRHELRLVLDSEILMQKDLSEHDLSNGSLVDNVVKACVPEGIRYELVCKERIHPVQHRHPILVILIVYTGELVGISREMADEIRASVEDKVSMGFGLSVAKRGRMVSKPFPYRLLHEVLTPNQVML